MSIEPVSRDMLDRLKVCLTGSPQDQRLDVARWLHEHAEDLGYSNMEEELQELEGLEQQVIVLQGRLEEVTGELENALDQLIPAPVRRLQQLLDDLQLLDPTPACRSAGGCRPWGLHRRTCHPSTGRTSVLLTLHLGILHSPHPLNTCIQGSPKLRSCM